MFTELHGRSGVRETGKMDEVEEMEQWFQHQTALFLDVFQLLPAKKTIVKRCPAEDLLQTTWN